MKKVVVVFVIILVLAGAWFAYSRYQAAQASSADAILFETGAIEKGQLVSTIDALGKVRSRQSAVLNWETSGTIEAVKVSIGDSVKKGDLLAIVKGPDPDLFDRGIVIPRPNQHLRG